MGETYDPKVLEALMLKFEAMKKHIRRTIETNEELVPLTSQMTEYNFDLCLDILASFGVLPGKRMPSENVIRYQRETKGKDYGQIYKDPQLLEKIVSGLEHGDIEIREPELELILKTSTLFHTNAEVTRMISQDEGRTEHRVSMSMQHSIYTLLINDL